jgi:uncharacterized phiE125 gp8 family phage protein
MSSTVAGQYELVDRYPYDGKDPIWPVTLADLKQHIQLSHNVDDHLLFFGQGGFLADATQEIESRGQVSLIQQKRRILLDYLPCEDTIYLNRGPVSTVTAIKYLDKAEAEQTLNASYYRAITKGRKNQVYFKSTTSGITTAEGSGVVWIEYTAGFGTNANAVPAQWRTLVAAVAYHLYERRGIVAGGGLDEAFERVIDRKVKTAGASCRYV